MIGRIINVMFKLPVTRVKVLKHVKSLMYYYCTFGGLCSALSASLDDYHIYKNYTKLKYYFPLFTYENAQKFGANGCPSGYWWDEKDWKNGRMEFLNWLIEQYKDDKTNLRNIL